MKWNGLWVFIDFFFCVKLVIRWSNSYFKLIIVIGSKFGSNLAIKSSCSHCKHFLAIGSNQI